MGKLFVTVFAKPCSQDKSYQNVHPDTRHYTQYKSDIPGQFSGSDQPCTATPDSASLRRDKTAPVNATNFVTGDRFAAPIKPVPRHA